MSLSLHARMRRNHSARLLCFLFLCCAFASRSAAQEIEKESFFESRIRPLLSEHCYACHTESSAKGELRLDSREAMLEGGTSGPALVPGNPDRSPLIQTILSDRENFRMPPEEPLPERAVADLIKWVKSGAVWPAEGTPFLSDFAITPEQKAFWSFQQPKEHPVPAVKRQGWPRNSIDFFVLAKLEEKGLKPASASHKKTLIRRASYDLIGLPPTPEAIEAFLADDSPDAFLRLINRLLASPHYGERWGRHWLDLVRYADTAGDSSDYPIPQMYLYRNYVIDSFNCDKPYDQFIREQIAGDLLSGESEKQRWERVIAAGYLASARRFSVRPERNMHLTIEDTIDNVGKTFLGLSIGCARCHDHKYDPISRQDYYGLYGIFDSTRYPFAGSENIKEQQDLIPRPPPSRVNALLGPYRAKLAALDEKIERLQEERRAALAQTGQRKASNRDPDEIRSEIRRLQKLRKPIFAQMPDVEMAFTVADGEPHNAKIHLGGDPRKPGPEVPRRFLQILGGHELPSWARGSGRLQLAEWLSAKQNPLTARVMVNRIWKHHFGEGIVSTLSNFGKRGAPPTHPKLLDHLAVQFMQNGWSIKTLHRLIMSSQTYQMASQTEFENTTVDPDNRLLRKFNRRRLDAEAIRDSLLFLSGSLDTTVGEAHPFPHQSTWGFTQHKPFVATYDSKRRSIYLMTQRIQKHPYLSIFDGADPNASTVKRSTTTTPIQALFMMNSEFVHERAQEFAGRLIAEVSQLRLRIDRAHRFVLGRPAAGEELANAEKYLQQARQTLATEHLSESERDKQALASYLRALFSSNEFLYVD